MTDEVPADLLFLQWLIDECGYLSPKPIGGGKYACVIPKIYTHAIAVGRIGDCYGIDDSWCYASYVEAALALARWDGAGEPEGWVRHPASGRRVSRDPDERDDDGKPVGAIGVLYVRG
jgi:hypothetical protein